jgi:hypothetical protein
MKLEDLEAKLGIANMGEEDKLALVKDIQANLPALKAEQRSLEAKTQANLVVEAIKKIKEGLEARFDELNGIVDAKVRDVTSGKDGIDGKDGKNGKDGKDGKDGLSITGPKGADGEDGEDGVGVQDAHIDFDGSLIITLTDGRELNVGEVVPMDVAEKIKIIGNGGGTSQSVLDSLTSLQNQINTLTGIDGTLGTMAQQDDTSVDINGGAIDGTTIGSTTPAAGTFTTLTATGQTSLGGAAGANNFRVLGTTGTINYWQAVGGDGATTNPRLSVEGTSGNTSAQIASKGTGVIQFITGGTSNLEQMRVAHTASAVNYVQVTGAATTKGTIISSQGSDSNISSVFQSKGTGAIDLAAGSSGVNISNGGTVTAITRTSGGSAYTTNPTVAISAPTTAGGVQATATCVIWMGAAPTVVSGGTGYTVNDVVNIVGGTYTQQAQGIVTAVSGGVVTAVAIGTNGAYTAAPSGTLTTTGGTGTGLTVTVSNWVVSSTFTITNAGSGYVEQPTVTFSGGGGSGAAAYATVGAEPTIKSLFGSTTAGLALATAYGPQLRLIDIGDGTRPLLVNGGSAGGAQTTGITANAILGISAGGGNPVSFYTNGRVTTEQLRVSHTASAVNYVQVTGNTTTLFPNISAQGSDSNIGLTFASKGSQSIRFNTNSTDQQFRITHTGSAVNYVQVTGNIAGSSPRVLAEGSDTDIDLTLTPKGAGNVRFGTYTAGVLTPTGYITIKDSGGTTRRLLVG